MGNLAHFEHKRTLFNMDNTIVSLTSGAYATAGGLKPEQGAELPGPLTLLLLTIRKALLGAYFPQNVRPHCKNGAVFRNE